MKHETDSRAEHFLSPPGGSARVGQKNYFGAENASRGAPAVPRTILAAVAEIGRPLID
ncbi:hypothetical protein [Mesorhizobium sp. 131-2-1]|uniref:hypothetical protein n=1 Tax=Mesorhizobium sp. 131-2-1 TaxID=2744518 RepID=UPI001925B2BB|nr:hypothetical protein [Mesorhizobium sp. 131-2-1]